MDSERAIEFLLEQQVKTEVQLQTIRDLLQGGIKMVITYQTETSRRTDALLDAQIRSEEKLSRLAEAQEATERKWQAFIDSLKKGTNGKP